MKNINDTHFLIKLPLSSLFLFRLIFFFPVLICYSCFFVSAEDSLHSPNPISSVLICNLFVNNLLLLDTGFLSYYPSPLVLFLSFICYGILFWDLLIFFFYFRGFNNLIKSECVYFLPYLFSKVIIYYYPVQLDLSSLLCGSEISE